AHRICCEKLTSGTTTQHSPPRLAQHQLSVQRHGAGLTTWSSDDPCMHIRNEQCRRSLPIAAESTLGSYDIESGTRRSSPRTYQNGDETPSPWRFPCALEARQVSVSLPFFPLCSACPPWWLR